MKSKIKKEETHMNKKVKALVEELGSAAAKPHATVAKSADISEPKIANKDVYGSDEHMQAEEVKEVIVESELGAAAAKPVATKEGEGKSVKVSLSNSHVYPAAEHKQTEEIQAVIVESFLEASKGLLEGLNYDTKKYTVEYLIEQVGLLEGEEETVEIPTDAQADVEIEDGKLVIELPIAQEEIVDSEVGAAVIQEALKGIYAIFASRLNEEGSVEIPADAEAEVKVEDEKLVIEIPTEMPEQVSDEQIEALQEHINLITLALTEGFSFKDIYPESQYRRDRLVEEFVAMPDADADKFLTGLSESSLELFEGIINGYVGLSSLNEGAFGAGLRNLFTKYVAAPVARVGNFAQKTFINPVTNTLRNARAGFDQFGNAVASTSRRVGNFFKTGLKQAGNVAGSVFVDTPRILGKRIVGGLDQMVINSAQRKAAGQARKQGETAATAEESSAPNVKDITKKAQNNRKDKILADREALKQQLATKMKDPTATYADVMAAKDQLRTLNRETGGFLGLGNFLRKVSGGKIDPTFLYGGDSRKQIERSGSTAGRLASRRAAARQGRIDQAGETAAANDPSVQRAANRLATSQANVADEVGSIKAARQRKGEAIAAAGKETDQGIVGAERSNANRIERGRQMDVDQTNAKIDNADFNINTKVAKAQDEYNRAVGAAPAEIKGVKGYESVKNPNDPILKETYTRKELEVVFEALNLDTSKYTFEFLAEELGFAAAKPHATAARSADISEPKVLNKDVYGSDEHMQGEEVEGLVIESVQQKIARLRK
jgi:hypothetical protein